MTNRMTNKAIFFAAFALVFAVAMTLALAPAKTDTVYADGTTYYLVGTMNDWTTSDAYVLTKNNEAVGEEYYIDIDLTYPELVGNGGAQFKVVSNNNVWYPGGENNNYTINKVGNYRVYFRPNGDGGDGWHYNVIYVERKASTFHRGTINVSELRTDDYLQPDEGMLYVYVDVARWNFYWVNTADGDSMSARQDYYNGETVEIPFGYRYRMDMYGDPGLPDYLWGCRYGYWDFSDDCIVKWDDGVVRVYPKPEGVQGGPGNGTMYDYDEDISPEWAGICNQTYKIVFEEGVTHVGNRSFRMYGNLREIVFASTVTSIGSEAFAYSGLTTLNIPDTVRSVGNYAFEYNTSLKGGTFPCASVGEGVFMCCSALTDLDWLDGVKSIGSGAFLGCTGLVDVTLPASITSIGSGAFGRCSNLERIHLPNGLTSIPSGIVGKCDKLTEVIIGANVSYIDHGAFEGCNASFYFVVPGEPHDVTIENGYVGGGGFAFPDGAVPHYIYEEGVSHEDIYLYSVVERIVEGRQNFLHSNNNAYSRTFNWRNKNRLLAYNSGDCEVVLADIDFAGKITVKPRTDGGEGNDGSGQMGDATDYNPLGCWPVLPV